MESHITSLRRQVCLVTFQLSCVACVSARVPRESWDESTLQLSRNDSIGNACYTGYSQVFIPYGQIRSLHLAFKTTEFCVRCDTHPYTTLKHDSSFAQAVLVLALLISCFRGTQREDSSKPLKHSIVKRILVFKRQIQAYFYPLEIFHLFGITS